MSVKSILLFAGAAMGHTIFSRSTKFGCGAPDPTDEHFEMSRLFAEKEAIVSKAFDLSATDTVEVNIYLHSVASREDSLLSVSFLYGQDKQHLSDHN